jgi:fumarylpyruvate hydrolase
MTTYLFTPPPVVSIPVKGIAEQYPVRRIFCVGRNYEAHAKEMGVQVDRQVPFYFTKSPDTYVPSGATIGYPPGTKNYHYEMELVVVIGNAGFRIDKDTALEHVYGYACGLDMTRRDLQTAAREQSRPWDLGKDFEESAVISEIVPASAIGHPSAGLIELGVNGETRQSSDLNLLIHSIADLLVHLSCYYHLTPGDVIFTGTPEGVGAVKPGDKIDGKIDNVGTIELTIKAA